MRRISTFAYLLTCLLAYLLIAPSAFAHILQTDGTIGAVLHIDPNDDPIAGQQASLFFEFKDTTNKFTPQNCDCKILIVENGTTIYAQPLFHNSSSPTLENASVFYTFPNPDVYQVIVTGAPIIKNGFQAFKIIYNIRAEQPTPTSIKSPKLTNFLTANVGFVIAGIIIALFFMSKAISNYRRHKRIFPKS